MEEETLGKTDIEQYLQGQSPVAIYHGTDLILILMKSIVILRILVINLKSQM